jgi:hypothetical protein
MENRKKKLRTKIYYGCYQNSIRIQATAQKPNTFIKANKSQLYK